MICDRKPTPIRLFNPFVGDIDDRTISLSDHETIEISSGDDNFSIEELLQETTYETKIDLTITLDSTNENIKDFSQKLTNSKRLDRRNVN